MSAAAKEAPYAPKGVTVLMNALHAAANAEDITLISMSGTRAALGTLNGLTGEFVCGYTGIKYRVSLEEVQR